MPHPRTHIALLLSALLILSCGGEPFGPDGTRESPKAKRERQLRERGRLAEAREKAAKAREAEEARLRRWTYEQFEDEMSGGIVRMAKVISQNTFQLGFPYQGVQRGVLTLRSHPRFGKDVIIDVQAGQIVCGYPSCRIDVRFGDGDSVRWRATEPESNRTTTLFLRRFKRFVKKVERVDVLRVELTFYQEGTRVLEFDVSGLEW